MKGLFQVSLHKGVLGSSEFTSLRQCVGCILPPTPLTVIICDLIYGILLPFNTFYHFCGTKGLLVRNYHCACVWYIG